MRPRTVVAHPGAQHSYRLAVALQHAELLQSYLTNMYWDEEKQPYKALANFPVLGRIISEKAKRRYHPDLRRDLVKDINPWGSLFDQALKRIASRSIRERWMFAQQRSFALRAAAYANQHADVFVGYDTASLSAFQWFRHTKSSVVKVLDLSHPHVNGYRILEEEMKLLPDWASTIDAPLDYTEIAWCLEEQKMADHIIVASSFSKQSVMADGVSDNRISVVPYGVDLTRFIPRPARNSSREDVFKILFVGQVGQRKGIKYLLEAFRILTTARNNVELSVAGAIIDDTPALRAYESEHCRFLGRVSEDQLDLLMRSADVFILPSLVEGFGLVLLEAMASGVPIIGTPNTGAPDLISDGNEGFIVPIRDSEILARRLTYMVDNLEATSNMGLAARIKAEEYPWKRYEDQIVNVFSTLWENYPSQVKQWIPGK